MELNNKWVESIKSIYLWNLIAWSAATLILVLKPIIDTLVKSDFIDNPVQALIYMALAFPGTLYFFLQARKLNAADQVQAEATFDRIMKVHNPAGIAGIVGAVLGLLPFLVNVTSPFMNAGVEASALELFWMNANLLLPWISLYGFVTFYVVAAVINRKRKKQRIEQVTKS